MKAISKRRSDRKRKALLATTEVFLDKGYDCTSMDDVAAKATISKPTVYKYFSGKERLFAEIVRATTGEIDDLLRLAAECRTQPRSWGLLLIQCRTQAG